jgi:alkylation response protein AidB-like acyl-CoA dehydrogenase
LPGLPDELELFRQTVRARAEARIGPLIESIDRTGSFSAELWEELRATEIFGLSFGEEHGGSGGTFLSYIVAIEELARVGAIAGLYSGTTVQVAGTLIRYGTTQQQERWLPVLTKGLAPAAWAFTEPQTGSDPAQIETRARRVEGGGWELSGQKLFISYARQACVVLVFARADDGLAAFLVESGLAGYSTGAPVGVLGMAGTEAAPIHLDGVRLPDDAIVGGPGDGFRVLLAGEAEGKVRASAINVGIAERATEEAAVFALARLHRGRSIAEKFPTIQAMLGEMWAQVDAARAHVRYAAALVDSGDPELSDVAAATRLVSGRCAREVTSNALQICGAYGWTKELQVERLYREAKFFEVTQGVAELQKLIVGRGLLGRFRAGR